MCKFCDNKRKNIKLEDSEEYYKLTIDGTKAYITNPYEDFVSYFEFKYCPFCGKKLEEEI